MSDPITTNDLYGTSTDKPSESSGADVNASPVSSPPESHEDASSIPSATSVHDLPIEETPEILPIGEPAPSSVASVPPQPNYQQPKSPPEKSGSLLRSIGSLLLFIIIFVLGVGLSSWLKQYIPTDFGPSQTPTPTPHVNGSSGSKGAIAPADPYASWKKYVVTSGATRLPFGGVSYSLPADILSPICDGSNCASVGTYLPGGTRFTVAPRGSGQVLPDFRGSIISDVGGIVFTNKSTTVAGFSATEFTGTFVGRTVSGYAFSKMRGVMIPLSATQSIEINHFTPNGIVADFDSDDALFGSILKTVVITGNTPVPTVSVLPTVSVKVTPTPTKILVPSKAPTATSSGY